MRKRWGMWAIVAIGLQGACYANSVNLFNDSLYTLDAVIYDATGAVLGEFTLNPRDAVEWSDDQENFGTEIEYASETPYTVDWMCMSGAAYGTCTDVSAGAVVTAQSCSGPQQCSQQQQRSGY